MPRLRCPNCDMTLTDSEQCEYCNWKRLEHDEDDVTQTNEYMPKIGATNRRLQRLGSLDGLDTHQHKQKKQRHSIIEALRQIRAQSYMTRLKHTTDTKKQKD
jgi:hypothetical protein